MVHVVERQVQPGEVFTAPDIDLEENSLMPPELLQEARVAMRGELPRVGYEWLLKLREEKPRDFVRDVRQWEAEWREQVIRVKRALEGSVSVVGEVDEGLEGVVEILERVLRGEVEVGGGE